MAGHAGEQQGKTSCARNDDLSGGSNVVGNFRGCEESYTTGAAQGALTNCGFRVQVRTARYRGRVVGYETDTRPLVAGGTDLPPVSLLHKVAPLEEHEVDAGAQRVDAADALV